MKTIIGVMQGRLIPPINGKLQAFPEGQWEAEFPRAKEAGLDCIEWIYDLEPIDANPIMSADGLRQIHDLIEKTGVKVRSICADYFMRRPLFGSSPTELSHRVATLTSLIEHAVKLAARRIVIPFVDESSLSTDPNRAEAAAILREVAVAAAQAGITIDLETDLPPRPFALFLDRVSAANVRVNYDSGNSASLGYAPREELAAYGDRLGSVHIKDRVRGGGSVPLGAGDTDFAALFAALRQCNYQGDFILQAARGADGDEVAHCRANRAFVDAWLVA